MSPVLPFEIIALIIGIVGENEDTNLLKELALVSHSFLQICRKHLFATVELHDTFPKRHIAFVELLKNRPDVVKYIRKLTYKVGQSSFNNDDHLLSPILPNLLRTISRLNCLTINGLMSFDWSLLDSSLKSVFLHLMQLPTINHIDLSCMRNPPVSSLILSVNLRRLDIFWVFFDPPEEGPEIVVQSGVLKILELRTSASSPLTWKLLHAKRQDGQPAFNIMDLRRLSSSFACLEDERNIRHLLQNAELPEKLHLSVGITWGLVGLHDILSSSARTLKVLTLTISLYDISAPLAGLCEELEAMAGHNMLEALSVEFKVVYHMTEDFVGSIIQNVENVLVKPGWSALRKVSFKVSLPRHLVSSLPNEDKAKVIEALQSLPDKYLSHLPKLESIAFNYLVRLIMSYEPVDCGF